MQRFDSANGWRQREEAQDRFLAQVQSAAPQVLEDLHALLPLYSEIPEKRYDYGSDVVMEASHEVREAMNLPECVNEVKFHLGSYSAAWIWSDVKTATASGDPAVAPLCKRLHDWAARWIKDEPNWLMNEALKALHRWHRESVEPHLDARSELDWAPRDPYPSYKYHSTTLNEPVEFVFSHRGWRFEGETPREWINELDKAFNEAKSRYLQAMAEAVDHALGEYLVSVAATRETSAWYMPAFVDYQILELSRVDLTAKYDRSRESVDDMIKIHKELLGIKPRREPRRLSYSKNRVRRPPRQKPVRTGIKLTPP